MKKGTHQKKESIAKIKLSRTGKCLSDKNSSWKGDKVGYHGVHKWVKKWKGKPNLCENCGITTAKRYHWANIDHKYRRVLEDYIRLCPKCHSKYDLNL